MVNSSSTLVLSEIDFAFSVSDIYNIISLDQPGTQGSVVGNASLDLDNTPFYYHDEASSPSSPIVLPNGTVLFEIWLYAYAGTTVNVNFDFVRLLDFNTGECCSPIINSDPVVILGNPPCTNNDVVFSISDPVAINDCQMRYRIFLEETQSLFNFTTMLVEVEVDLPAGAAINTVNSLYCPGSCVLYPNLNNCIAQSGSSISYGFCQPNTMIPGGVALFEVIVDLEIGTCVENITFLTAEVSLQNDGNCTARTNDLNDPDCKKVNGISGGIKSCCSGDPIPDVQVSLSPDNSSCNPAQVQTDQEGQYAQCVCPEDGTTYLVKPTKDDNVRCGVSTLDLVMIQRHILGLELITDPCKIIAGDVNCDGKLSASDLLELRKVILGVTASFPMGCDSWVFVDADYVFPDPSDPFDYPDFVKVVLPESKANFTGIKKGDVNCSCEEEEELTTGGGTVAIKDQSIPTGTEVWVDVKGSGFGPQVAYQFGLQFDPVLIDITAVAAGDVPYFSTDNFELDGADGGSFATSWISRQGVSGEIVDGAVLFRMKVKALTPITSLNQVIRLANTAPVPRGYGGLGENYSLALQFEGRSGGPRSATVESPDWATTFYPNPVTEDALQIYFQVPQAGTVDLQIFDVLGSRVYHHRALRAEGGHQLQITGLDQWSRGVYTYRLTLNNQSQSGKLIVQ